MKIILGSGSKSRQDILKEMGYDFEIMTADIDEKAIRDDDPSKMVLMIARAKAKALLPQISERALLITSDQVVTWHDEVREKPENEEQARQFIKSYSNDKCSTVGGVVVTNTETGESQEIVDIATTFFKEIPDEVIEQMIAKGDVFYLAGAFSVEDPLLTPFVIKVEGTIDSVMGLPKAQTEQMIKALI